jgi:four helix bundle protein
MSGAVARVCEDVMVTSGSFGAKGSRWPADVKGKPVKPVRSTLDIGRLTGSRVCMNDPEVTMSNVLTNTNLIAHEKALEAAGDAITLAMKVPAPLKSIADQVIRSASSVPANLAEGHGRTGRDRLHFWRIAYASAKEVDSHLKLLAHAGAVNRTRIMRALSTFDEVRAMTWRLLNPTVDR